MAKVDELKKEAEQYRKIFENELYMFDNTEIFPKDIEEAYLKGAEPREKRIAELEKANENLVAQSMILIQRNAELEQENALLKGRNEGFEQQIMGLLIKYEEVYKRFPDLKGAMDKALDLQKENAELKDMVKEMYFLLRNYDKFFLGDRLLKCFETVENYNFLKESEVKK